MSKNVKGTPAVSGPEGNPTASIFHLFRCKNLDEYAATFYSREIPQITVIAHIINQAYCKVGSRNKKKMLLRHRNPEWDEGMRKTMGAP